MAGFGSAIVNGSYHDTGNMVNGKPSYMKTVSPNEYVEVEWLMGGPPGTWAIIHGTIAPFSQWVLYQNPNPTVDGGTWTALLGSNPVGTVTLA